MLKVTIDWSKVTDIFFHIMLYQVNLAIDGNASLNLSVDVSNDYIGRGKSSS